MNTQSQSQNRTALILIGVGVVFLAGAVLGFNVIDVIGSIFGAVIGTLGSIFGGIMGAIGSIIGSVFGALGSIIGSIADILGSIINGVFGTVGTVADVSWPFILILPGLALVALAVFGPVATAPLAVPGMVVSGTGAILLFQSMTGRWETWAYLWALYPVFAGAAMMLMSARTGNAALAEAARKTMLVGAGLTLGFGLFFELIFTGGSNVFFQYGLPAAFIVGGYLLLRKRDVAPATEKPKHDMAYAAPLPEKPKKSSKYGISPDLERQINEALADDDDLI